MLKRFLALALPGIRSDGLLRTGPAANHGSQLYRFQPPIQARGQSPSTIFSSRETSAARPGRPMARRLSSPPT